MRPGNKPAALWKKKITAWLKNRYPGVTVTGRRPQALVVLGGDGTILEAAKRYQTTRPAILGLNMGHVGFLASVRDEKNFLAALDKLLRGKYWTANRIMAEAEVIRDKRAILSATALNEIMVHNPLGMVRVEVAIQGHPVQYIQGTGALVATPTGSTGFNLSAHGPIVVPDMDCLILTEVLDHNIPTPSIVVKGDQIITLKVLDFRQRGVLSVSKTGRPVDVVMTADGQAPFALLKNDRIVVKRSKHAVTFVELEKNYFFNSLREKFGFR